MKKSLIIAIAIVLISAFRARAVAWDRDDFIVSDWEGGRVAIYDHDFAFKGYLNSSLAAANGIAFDSSGNIVVTGGRGRARGSVTHFLTYGRDGVQMASFDKEEFWFAYQLDIGPSGNYYVAIDSGLVEINSSGETLRRFGGVGRFFSVAVVNDSNVWTGRDRETLSPPYSNDELKMFDLATGTQVGSKVIEGQPRISSMFYTESTASVLISNWYETPYVGEYDLAGNLIRSFFRPANLEIGFGWGVTRGPGGDVFATTDYHHKIFRWAADGTFVGSYDLPELVATTKIVWAGNSVPEPSTLAIIALAAGTFLAWRRGA